MFVTLKEPSVCNSEESIDHMSYSFRLFYVPREPMINVMRTGQTRPKLMKNGSGARASLRVVNEHLGGDAESGTRARGDF